MRLNRRKNRRSRGRRRRSGTSERRTPAESPVTEGEERRRGLARAVKSARGTRVKRGERSRRARALKRRAPALMRAARAVAVDVVGIAREIVRWPVRIWMAVAEALGAGILLVWRQAVVPVLRL